MTSRAKRTKRDVLASHPDAFAYQAVRTICPDRWAVRRAPGQPFLAVADSEDAAWVKAARWAETLRVFERNRKAERDNPRHPTSRGKVYDCHVF